MWRRTALSSAASGTRQKWPSCVRAIALKDTILPGDIQDILNQVVTAEKKAQANLILSVRLKELETLEKIAGKVEKITVAGGLDALIEGTVMLRSK